METKQNYNGDIKADQKKIREKSHWQKIMMKLKNI